jgi:hypothetical protein
VIGVAATAGVVRDDCAGCALGALQPAKQPKNASSNAHVCRRRGDSISASPELSPRI